MSATVIIESGSSPNVSIPSASCFEVSVNGETQVVSAILSLPQIIHVDISGIVTGAPGKSAYELWLDLGNTGTIDDFFEYLRGGPGGNVDLSDYYTKAEIMELLSNLTTA